MSEEITWHSFEDKLAETSIQKKFEDLCRQLFSKEFAPSDGILLSAANNPGLETEPIVKNGKRLGFQCKFFKNRVNYAQIRHSADMIIKYYANKVDVVYLFCNKDISINADSFKSAEDVLHESNITLKLVTNDNILDRVRNYPILRQYYFGKDSLNADQISQWNKSKLNELGARFNSSFNVDTKVNNLLTLFVRNQGTIRMLNYRKVSLLQDVRSLLHKMTLAEYKPYLQELYSTVANLKDVTPRTIPSALDWYSVTIKKLSSERECKIVCVNRYCMNLLYAPYWGKQR